MRILPLLSLTALLACSPPADRPDPPPSPPAVAACNTVAPDLARFVSVQAETAASTPAAELRGGRIVPGTYDLVSAVRIGGATGWTGERAVALGVNEGDTGVVLNWAGASRDGTVDTWTATLAESPDVRLTFTCGRIGDVDAAFTAGAEALELRIQDGASGALGMVFQRRSG